jgi:hypothetical protein
MDLNVENLFIGNIGGGKEAGREPSLVANQYVNQPTSLEVATHCSAHK